MGPVRAARSHDAPAEYADAFDDDFGEPCSVVEVTERANGGEHLTWSNAGLVATKEPDVAHLPAGHPIDLESGGSVPPAGVVFFSQLIDGCHHDLRVKLSLISVSLIGRVLDTARSICAGKKPIIPKNLERKCPERKADDSAADV